MPSATSALAHGRRAASASPGQYENWRPPIVWAAVLVLVESDHLLVNDTSGHGHLVLPGTAVSGDQEPAQAARHALLGSTRGIPIARQVALDHTQMRRRQVTVHVFASTPLRRSEADALSALDGRAITRILPITEASPLLPQRASAGLAALETGGIAHLGAGVLQRLQTAPTVG